MTYDPNEEKRKELEPVRMFRAKEAVIDLGYDITEETEKSIVFSHKGCRVDFYPYTGWHTGKSITDGRGLKNLIKQLNKQ